MTARGRGALALGVGVYLAAWAFGSRALYPVAVGLFAAVLLAWLAVRLSARPLRLHRTLKTQPVEQEDVQVRVELELESPFAPAGITLVDRYAKLGERRIALHRAGRFLWGRYVLASMPRGRYPVESVDAEVEDPFGLARIRIPLGRQPAIIVYPRLVELDRVFSDAGVHMRDGRRLLLQRPSGFDVHSVRNYVEGDSLRKVHWPSTARRAQLMVKEVEDSPRDELAVVLDAHSETARATFDIGVRAAGSLLDAYARRGRRAVLVLAGATRVVQRVHAEGDWLRALELLAAADADGSDPAVALLAGEGNPASMALDLVIVTSRLPGALVERLVQRAAAHRSTALVHVDGARRPEPALLRLQRSGVAVASIGPRDDLAEALSGVPLAEAANA
jgi:uncharacterized protein (DUF58 family)